MIGKVRHSANSINFGNWVPPEKRPLPHGLFVTEEELQDTIDAARGNIYPEPERVERLDPWEYFKHDVKEAAAIRDGRYIATRVIHDERAIEETRDIIRQLPPRPVSQSDYMFDLVTGRGDFVGDRGMFFRSRERKLSSKLPDELKETHSNEPQPSSSSSSSSSLPKPNIQFSDESSDSSELKRIEPKDSDERPRYELSWSSRSDVVWDIRSGLCPYSPTSDRPRKIVGKKHQFHKPIPTWMRRLYRTIDGLAEKDKNGQLVIPHWKTDLEWHATLEKANRLIEAIFNVKSFFALLRVRENRMVTNASTELTDNGYIKRYESVQEEPKDRISDVLELDELLSAEEFLTMLERYNS